jgi:tetratricopeptide (TPR) repeat protein
MAQKFDCPSCGAGLGYAGGDDPVVKCSYCGGTVVVPEDLRARPPAPEAPAWTASFPGAPLAIDLSGISGKVATLKNVKQLVRDGRLEEAAQAYQQAFRASEAEARQVVTQLAAGQSVVISSGNFSQVLPVLTRAPDLDPAQQASSAQVLQAAQAAYGQSADFRQVKQPEQARQASKTAGCIILLAGLLFILIMAGVAAVLLFTG